MPEVSQACSVQLSICSSPLLAQLHEAHLQVARPACGKQRLAQICQRSSHHQSTSSICRQIHWGQTKQTYFTKKYASCPLESLIDAPVVADSDHFQCLQLEGLATQGKHTFGSVPICSKHASSAQGIERFNFELQGKIWQNNEE